MTANYKRSTTDSRQTNNEHDRHTYDGCGRNRLLVYLEVGMEEFRPARVVEHGGRRPRIRLRNGGEQLEQRLANGLPVRLVRLSQLHKVIEFLDELLRGVGLRRRHRWRPHLVTVLVGARAVVVIVTVVAVVLQLSYVLVVMLWFCCVDDELVVVVSSNPIKGITGMGASAIRRLSNSTLFRTPSSVVGSRFRCFRCFRCFRRFCL